MNIRERKDYNRLRRRSVFLGLVCFCLAVWIKNLYEDKNWYLQENRELFFANLSKDEMIKKNNIKIDSLQRLLNPPIQKEVVYPEKKINTNKTIKKDSTFVKDTVIIAKDSIDESSKINRDSLNE